MPGVRIGLVGPVQEAGDALERILTELLDDPTMRQVIYLGNDNAAQRVVDAWARERMTPPQFIDRSVELACDGSAEDIAALLEQERAARRLRIVRRLPDAPSRAVEMLDRWIMLAIHDKAVLDEEDIANAHIIVYGKASKASIKRFGPRCFFTPGPVDKGLLGRLELTPDGHVRVEALDLDGQTVLHEELLSSAAKVVVTP